MGFTAIDLFAGIGGFRLAVERAGGHCVAFSEIDADAIAAYTANHPGSAESNLGDITKIGMLPQADLLTAGVPCQSWSIAGRNLGFDDRRGLLWDDALSLLALSRPKAFIFENVKGLADPRNREALDYIHGRIKEAGYHAGHYVLNSFDYGVPQSRVRIFIIGFCRERFFRSFRLPKKSSRSVLLRDIMDDGIDGIDKIDKTINADASRGVRRRSPKGIPNGGRPSPTCLSANNNGFCDYFLFNDIRNGPTTIHSWDMLPTTVRQREICLLLLRSRRKRLYGPLDGNPMSLGQLRTLDASISQSELDELVALGILKTEKYSFAVNEAAATHDVNDAEALVLSRAEAGVIVPDSLVCDKEIKKARVSVAATLESLERKKLAVCTELRHEFRNTKISSGLDGICRVFLPSSGLFPTLVASDTNDYLTPVQIPAVCAESYKNEFISRVLLPRRFRKISRAEACRVQGFPDDFILPGARPRWMKLLGNSVPVPLVEKLVRAVAETGVFESEFAHRGILP